MKNNSGSSENQNILSRYKVFEYNHHLNHKIYRNKGVLKDAERFSLVDNVLDGEYNDIEIIEYRSKPESAKGKAGRLIKNAAANFYAFISGIAFKAALFLRLTVYYLLHIRYKAE